MTVRVDAQAAVRRANEVLRERTVDLGFYTDEESPVWVSAPSKVRATKQARELAELILALAARLEAAETALRKAQASPTSFVADVVAAYFAAGRADAGEQG